MAAEACHDVARGIQQALTLQQFGKQGRCIRMRRVMGKDVIQQRSRRRDLSLLPKCLCGLEAGCFVMAESR